MRIGVLGAGVVGLTTAWMLSDAGHDVVVIDRAATPGQGASQANGAQLSFSFVTPLASPETLRHLPALLLDRAGPLRIRPTLDPAFLRWALAFAWACRPAAVRATVAAQLELAALSRRELLRITAATGIEYGLREAGKLVLYRAPASFAAARAAATPGQATLSPAECLSLEPALRLGTADFAGGIYTASDMLGDCAAFCAGLATALRAHNTVAWAMGHAATPIIRQGRLTAVQTAATTIEADTFVCALGAGAAPFARDLGLRLPVYPLKGYSLTLRPAAGTPALAHSVTDADRKIVLAPLADGSLIRAAGVADLVGYDPTLDPARLATIRRIATSALAVDPAQPDDPWTGFRPATATSRPIVGWSKIPGLFLNTGHGALGWTLAAATARLTTDLLTR